MLNKLKIFFKIHFIKRPVLFLIFGTLFFLFSSIPLDAQPKPKIIQYLSFGQFYTGSTGGTVNVPSVGSRNATGSVVLFQSDPGYPAIIEVKFLNTNIRTITTGNIVNLTNGLGGSLTLQINDFYPASPFQSIKGRNIFRIGGTLSVGSPTSSTPGNYSGSFEVTFNDQ